MGLDPTVEKLSTVPRLHAPVVSGDDRGPVTVVLQRPAMGVGVGLALQFTVGPPLAPIHDQFHGPLPLTALGVPELQSPETGTEGTVDPFDVPQTPGVGVFGTVPLHVALHFHG